MSLSSTQFSLPKHHEWSLFRFSSQNWWMGYMADGCDIVMFCGTISWRFCCCCWHRTRFRTIGHTLHYATLWPHYALVHHIHSLGPLHIYILMWKASWRYVYLHHLVLCVVCYHHHCDALLLYIEGEVCVMICWWWCQVCQTWWCTTWLCMMMVFVICIRRVKYSWVNRFGLIESLYYSLTDDTNWLGLLLESCSVPSYALSHIGRRDMCVICERGDKWEKDYRCSVYKYKHCIFFFKEYIIFFYILLKIIKYIGFFV